jgi:hypothetical protein
MIVIYIISFNASHLMHAPSKELINKFTRDFLRGHISLSVPRWLPLKRLTYSITSHYQGCTDDLEYATSGAFQS